jgi:hypothetical protein
MPPHLPVGNGAPGRTRTYNPQIRNLMPYPLGYGCIENISVRSRYESVTLLKPAKTAVPENFCAFPGNFLSFNDKGLSVFKPSRKGFVSISSKPRSSVRLIRSQVPYPLGYRRVLLRVVKSYFSPVKAGLQAGEELATRSVQHQRRRRRRLDRREDWCSCSRAA